MQRLFSFLSSLLNKSIGPGVKTDCWHCEYLLVGHLDRVSNWMECDKGHCVIADEELTVKHHLYHDRDEEIVMLTKDHFAVRNGFGEPMIDRTDCSDWKRKGYRLHFGNPEYE